MKRIVLFLLFFSSIAAAAQQVSPLRSETDYLKKSRQQKNWAKASFITGSVTALVGGYLWFMAPLAGLSEAGNVEAAERTGKSLVIAGGSVAAISIPLFMASKKNREKAVLQAGTSSIHLPGRTILQTTAGLKLSF